MKKILKILATFCLSVFLIVGCSCKKSDELPKAEASSSYLGQQFGLDKNITVENIDDYLNRSDVVYRDMRMLVDPANYEALDGGDRYLSGFVKGFEVVPLPYLIPVAGTLPPEVGEGYTGPTLFKKVTNADNTVSYIANYEESLDILNYLFPKDKKIFLMCGGGGYAGNTKTLLVSLGWNADNVYNVGGYWTYKGKNSVSTKLDNGNYDFSKVAYHNIDFSVLTEVGE